MKAHALAFLATALLLFLAPAAFAEERNGVGDHKAALDQDWPSVSEYQEHHVVNYIGCGGDGNGPCQNDWGTGTGAYGTCTVEHACSLTYGGCWFKVYAKCQDKTSGAGDACKAC
jgi:hypothetical protein